MASKKDVQRELKNLQKRIKNVEAHTGFNFSLDEAYYLSQKNRKKAENELKSLMRWKEADAGIKMGKHIKASTTGQLHYKYIKGEYTTQLTAQDVKQFAREIHRNEVVQKKPYEIKINIAGPNPERSKAAAHRYLQATDTKQKLRQHNELMIAAATNNFLNHVANAANVSGDAGLRALSIYLEAHKDELLRNHDKEKYKELVKLIDVEIYGSDDTDDAKIATNKKAFTKEIFKYFGIEKKTFLKELRDQGYAIMDLQEAINELGI